LACRSTWFVRRVWRQGRRQCGKRIHFLVGEAKRRHGTEPPLRQTGSALHKIHLDWASARLPGPFLCQPTGSSPSVGWLLSNFDDGVSQLRNLFLRHQLNIILRRPPQRLRLWGSDRALMVWMTRLWPSLLALARVVQPATILRWHRAGFRTYWRWKSQGRPGRPRIEHELRNLIRRMSKENPLWGRSADPR